MSTKPHKSFLVHTALGEKVQVSWNKDLDMLFVDHFHKDGTHTRAYTCFPHRRKPLEKKKLRG